MKKLLFLLAFALCPLAAQAQTPGAQPEFCVTSPSQTANYNQLCISASSSGGTIAVNNFGSATGGLNFSGGVGSAIALNVTSGGCTESPGVRAPIYVCNDASANNAGQSVGAQIWIGALPVGTPASNAFVAQTNHIDNGNGRGALWAYNADCVQLPNSGGFGTGIVHCFEANLVQSQVASTPTSAFTAGPVAHGYEAVCNQNTSVSPQPCQVGFWGWAAGDYGANSQFQPLAFTGSASRTLYAGWDCENISGDIGPFFTKGCLWNQATSVYTILDTGAHTYFADTSGATLSGGFANCGSAGCAFVGQVKATLAGTGAALRAVNSDFTGTNLTFLANGASKGIRMTSNSSGSEIDGTDNTGVASFQPLTINASDLIFAIGGGSIAEIISSAVRPVTTNSISLGNAGNVWSNVFATAYTVGSTAGASCTLTTVSHLTIVNGIVTLCN